MTLQSPRWIAPRRSRALCRCIQIRNVHLGTLYAITTWPTHITVPWTMSTWDVEFIPGQILEVKEQRRAADFQDGSFNFTVRIGETFTDAMIEGGYLHGAHIWVALVDPYAPHAGYLWAHGYTVDSVVRDGPAATFDCLGMTAPLHERIGHLWSTNCRNRFMDSRCNAQNDLAADQLARANPGTITAIASRQQFTITIARSTYLQLTDSQLVQRFADQEFFWSGSVRFDPGYPNAFQTVAILRTGQIELVGHPLPITSIVIHDIQLISVVGAKLRLNQPVQLLAGCDQANGTCRTRWHNTSNFRGAPGTPGSFELMLTPESE